jgi:hypothetical protein
MALSAALAIDIISQAALKAFNATIQALNSFSIDMSSDFAAIGKKVQFTWTPSGATVRQFGDTGTYVTEAPNQLPKELEIDKNPYVGFYYTDDQLATLSLLKLDEIGAQYGAALAEAVLADIWSLVKAASFANVIPEAIAADDFDSDDILDIGKQCTTLKWPKMGRNLIINEDYYTALCKDPAVKNAAAIGGTEAIRQGKVPALGTFENIFESTLIPDNGEELVGFAVNREAIGIAFRPVKPDTSAAKVMDYRIFTNESGMTIAFKEWYNPSTKKTERVLECNYGKCVGNPDGILRIIGADVAGGMA